jgi:hypothetical protein
MTETKRPVLASIPKSSFPGEKRLAMWKAKTCLMDEEGNEEPTVPNIHSELPFELTEEL